MRDDMHLDPEMRRRVFETVTLDEALAVMRTKAGRPWNKAAAEIIIRGLQDSYGEGEDGTSDPLSYVRRANRD